MEINIFNQLNRIEEKIERLLKGVNRMAATLDQVLQDVTDESTIEDSIITLLAGIQAQLTAALAGTSISAKNQAKIDAIFSGLEANKAKIAAAVSANSSAS